MVQCPVCRVTFVANTLFCAECGTYLPCAEQLSTEPLEKGKTVWGGEVGDHQPCPASTASLETGILRLLLCIGKDATARELEVALIKPIRLGRLDPRQDIFPEIDLTEAHALEQGVSRLHACIFRRGDSVEIEDLGSTNGTLLNGVRLAPYIPQPLEDGDQLQLGRLQVEVHFGSASHLTTR
jgi:hypothetical protein